MNGYTRFPEKFKLKIMKLYFDDNVPRKEILTKFNINPDTFKWWVKLYKQHKDDAFNVSQQNSRSFDDSFKLDVITEITTGNNSIKSTCIKYKLDPSVVRSWLKWYNTINNQKERFIDDMKYYKFTKEKKIEIAKHCIANNLNYTLTAKEYKISYSTVYNWTNKYSKLGANSLGITVRGKKTKEEKDVEFQQLKKEILKDFQKKKKHLLEIVLKKSEDELRDMMRKSLKG